MALIIVLAAVIGAYYMGSLTGQTAVTPSPSPSAVVTGKPTATPTTSPTPKASPTSNIPQGWQTYTSGKYGFQISHPANYKALADKDSLSGYPNGVVLIYSGGQAYDVVIESWNTQAEYESHYVGQISKLTVKLISGKYITLYDATELPVNKDIIATFVSLK